MPDLAPDIILPLKEPELKRLKEHKYSATGTSLLEPYFQVFWRWLVEQMPMWIAPNAITLIGLMCNLFPAILMMYYSPDAQSEVPAWVLIATAVGLFLYQSLDAIDGKQARRTKTQSSLGELFDHGCDAVSTVYVVVSYCVAFKMGEHPAIMITHALSASVTFYIAHWQTYCTGTLHFGYIDVTEAQLSCMMIFTAAAFDSDFGKVAILGFEIRMLVTLFSWGGLVRNIVGNLYTILFKGGVGKNGSTVADTSVIFPAVPLTLITVLGIMIYNKAESAVFEQNLCLYLVVFGTVLAKVTCKLVIAHMSKSELDFLDSSMLGPGVLFMNQYFNNILPEAALLWVAFIFCTFNILRYSATVCRQIADYLGIMVFSIRPPPARQD